MKPTRPVSIRDYRLLGQFQACQVTLLEERFAPCWDRPLVFWVLPDDRRLPLALLNHRLGELLQMPFDQVMATPGVGETKLRSLLMLMQRIARSEVQLPAAAPEIVMGSEDNGEEGVFDPAIVSESLWLRWRETIKRHGLEQEKLGRLAPTLQSMPTVIWGARFNDYVDATLDEVRRRRAHGEKRVHAILKVFHTTHILLAKIPDNRQFTVRLAPRFITIAEDWLLTALEQDVSIGPGDVRDHLVLPLLNQLELDLGDAIHRLAAERLGLESSPKSVKNQAERLGVTRARVYQLLDQAAQAVQIRWPAGEAHLMLLCGRMQGDFQDVHAESLRLARAVRDLFYPDRRQQEEPEIAPVEAPALRRATDES